MSREIKIEKKRKVSIERYRVFSKYDLYTKNNEVPDIEKLWPYYEKLIDKYIPGVLEW